MEKQKTALYASLICLVLGCAFMVISLYSVIIYGPLFFASFILSIVAMAKGQVWGGIVVLLGNLTLPFVILGIMFTAAIQPDDVMADEPTQKDTDNLIYASNIDVYELKVGEFTDFFRPQEEWSII